MNSQGLRPLYANLLAILLMTIIFTLSHQPDTGLEELAPWLPGKVMDLLHIPVYGLLALLYWFGTQHHFQNLWAALLFALILTLIYGISDEWHQSFIPGRDSSLDDIGKDFLGGLLTLLVVTYLKSREILLGQQT